MGQDQVRLGREPGQRVRGTRAGDLRGDDGTAVGGGAGGPGRQGGGKTAGVREERPGLGGVLLSGKEGGVGHRSSVRRALDGVCGWVWASRPSAARTVTAGAGWVMGAEPGLVRLRTGRGRR